MYICILHPPDTHAALGGGYGEGSHIPWTLTPEPSTVDPDPQPLNLGP